MKIPHFVDARKRTKKERQSARLKYVLGVIAAKNTGRQSMRALADMVGLDHSTLSTYIRRGSFSVPAAEKVIAGLQQHKIAPEVTVEQLIDPLLIEKVPG